MDWQTIIATLIVIAAASWLARRTVRLLRGGGRGGQIGGCGSCSKNQEAAKPTPLVQLGKNRDA